MQRVVTDYCTVVCDGCGTEYPSAHEYDPKRPVPQGIYLPVEFTVYGGLEYCAKCIKNINERNDAELAELRGEIVLGSEVPTA